MASIAPTGVNPAHDSNGVNGGAEGGAGRNGSATGSAGASAAPLVIGGTSAGGHSRKGSLLVGGPGAADGKRGPLAFGTVNSPNPLLSSSPAAPSVTGQHLADNVKSFGTIEADANTDPNTVKHPSRRTSGVSTPMSPPLAQGGQIQGLPSTGGAPKKEFNMHAGFGRPQMPQHAQQQQPQQQHQLPLQMQGQPIPQHPGQAYQQFRPSGPVRSPQMNNAVPNYAGAAPFRPPQGMQQQPIRTNGMAPRPYVPQGYPPQAQQQYMYQQNYYVSLMSRDGVNRID